ncbi:MAG: response regulator transcription factor [Bacteroidota bacterium]
MDLIKIALVDDQQLFRQSLASLITSNASFQLTGEFEDGRLLLHHLSSQEVLPDIVLLDMEMPGINGMEVNALLQKQFPSVKVIVLSIHTKERLIAKMIENGASGYLIKTCHKDELFSAIGTVFNTGFYINQQVLKAIQKASSLKHKQIRNLSGIDIDISEREKEILRLICSEMNAPEIAEKLFLSIRTVEGHRNNLLGKTGCRNTAGLVLFAVKNGIFELSV